MLGIGFIIIYLCFYAIMLDNINIYISLNFSLSLFLLLLFIYKKTSEYISHPGKGNLYKQKQTCARQ